MVSTELQNLTPKELRSIKAVIKMFHILGLSDEQIQKLPEIVSNWPTVVKNMNAFSEDLVKIKSEVNRLGGSVKGKTENEADTSANIAASFAFGNSPERIVFPEGNRK